MMSPHFLGTLMLSCAGAATPGGGSVRGARSAAGWSSGRAAAGPRRGGRRRLAGRLGGRGGRRGRLPGSVVVVVVVVAGAQVGPGTVWARSQVPWWWTVASVGGSVVVVEVEVVVAGAVVVVWCRRWRRRLDVAAEQAERRAETDQQQHRPDGGRGTTECSASRYVRSGKRARSHAVLARRSPQAIGADLPGLTGNHLDLSSTCIGRRHSLTSGSP